MTEMVLLLLLLSHFSHVRLCATPESAAHQAPRSLGFSRQEPWSGLPCSLPRALPNRVSSSVQFSSVAQSCLTLCNPMDCIMPHFPVHHQLPELSQTHVYQVGDAIQPSYPLSSPSPPAFNFSQHQSLFQWTSSSHQVAKVLELQPQHQSFQWIFRTNFL